MDAISRISSPLTDAWVAWILMLLLFLWIVNGMYVQEFKHAFYGLFSRAERVYTSNGNLLSLRGIVYEVGVLGLLVFLLLVRDGVAGNITNYGIVCGVCLVVDGFQRLCVNFLATIFLSRQEKESAILHRHMLYGSLCGMLLPIVMLLLWQINEYTIACVIAVAALYYIVLFVKGIQLFYQGVLSILYVLLYIISLEVLPLAGAFLLIKNML